jgi:hypothetical protein
VNCRSGLSKLEIEQEEEEEEEEEEGIGKTYQSTLITAEDFFDNDERAYNVAPRGLSPKNHYSFDFAVDLDQMEVIQSLRRADTAPIGDGDGDEDGEGDEEERIDKVNEVVSVPSLSEHGGSVAGAAKEAKGKVQVHRSHLVLVLVGLIDEASLYFLIVDGRRWQ